MIPIDLAMELDRAGLDWVPREGDRFAIPGHDLDGQVFSVSEMTIEVKHVVGGSRISFNGAVEWALDSIMKSDVVWLPTETQLRDRLGGTFRRLGVFEGSYVCVVDFGDGELEFAARSPQEAYGLALLELLRRPGLRLRTIVEGR